MARHEKIVNRMESKKPCKDNQTYRGLEAWTEEGTAMLDEVINRCVDAVLTEQEHQWVKQKDDFDRIATVSRSLTAECAKRAREVGKMDEDAAREAIADIWIEDDEGSKTPESVRRTAREMLEVLGPQKLIANLGEGLGGKESPRLVKAFVDAIQFNQNYIANTFIMFS